MTSHSTFVVVGAGQAAGRAVEAMRAEGFDVDDLLAKVDDGPDAEGILRRFADLIFGDSQVFGD